MLKKFIITLFPLLICLKTIALDMVLQQRSEAFLMSQEIQKEQNPMKKLRNTAQILSAKYTEFFIRPKDRNNAYGFAYNTLLKCMILSTINHERRQDWEKETEIPFAFKGFTFNQAYLSQNNDLFDKISTSIVWLLMHAFEIHCSEEHSQDQFREFWNRVLHWTSMARAAITLLSTENIPLGYEKDTNQGFSGLFTTRPLQEPWPLSRQLDAMWKYFGWDGADSSSRYGGMLSHGHIRVSHSEAHASTIAFDSFQEAFYFAYRLKCSENDDSQRMVNILLPFIYDMSWSSTCERGQAAMMNWVIHALALWAGYEITLPDESNPIFANTLQALNDKLPTEREKNLSFLRKYYSQPDVIALCCPTLEIFQQYYGIQLRKREKIRIKRLGASPFINKLPRIFDLSFQTTASSTDILESLRDGNFVDELRVCNILDDEGIPCLHEAYLCLLEKALLRCPNISKLVISRFSVEIIEKINRIARHLNTLELNEVMRIEGVDKDTPEMQINSLIIKNNRYSPSGYPFIFPEKGLKLLDKTLPKISFLELPFGKIDIDIAGSGVSPVQMPSFWKKCNV